MGIGRRPLKVDVAKRLFSEPGITFRAGTLGGSAALVAIMNGLWC